MTKLHPYLQLMEIATPSLCKWECRKCEKTNLLFKNTAASCESCKQYKNDLCLVMNERTEHEAVCCMWRGNGSTSVEKKTTDQYWEYVFGRM